MCGDRSGTFRDLLVMQDKTDGIVTACAKLFTQCFHHLRGDRISNIHVHRACGHQGFPATGTVATKGNIFGDCCLYTFNGTNPAFQWGQVVTGPYR